MILFEMMQHTGKKDNVEGLIFEPALLDIAGTIADGFFDTPDEASREASGDAVDASRDVSNEAFWARAADFTDISMP